MYTVSELIHALTEKGAVKPFSFLYDGKPFDFSGITPGITQKNGDQLQITYDLIPGLLQLSLDAVFYSDFPVVEYTPRLINTGKQPTGIISDFKSLDWSVHPDSTFGQARINNWILTNDRRVRIRYNLGSTCSPVDFFPQVRDLFPLQGSNSLELKCAHGRSSATFLPFMGIDLAPQNGINLAIGWSGAWKFNAAFDTIGGVCQGCGERGFTISSGMVDSSFRILPGERLLQPGIILHVRDGKDVADAQNEFRRFMVSHHAPRNGKGELQRPAICFLTWGGLESDKMLDRIKVIREHQLPYESFWIDAGWTGSDSYCPHFCEENTTSESDWYNRVGTWRINRYAHPNGIREVSETAHAAGLRMLVWFESERIDHQCGSPLLTEHKDWLLSREGEGSDLLNLGNPEALKYLIKTVGDILDEEKIDDYRQDFNIEPLPFWRAADAPDRKGVTEMKYIEGLYLFWQSLRKRFPDLFIDNCASGGRRLDYKLCDMSYPLCQSDFATYREYNEECIQLENIYLDQWIPLHGSLNWGENDLYHAFSALGCGYGSKIWQFNGREPEAGHDYDLHRKTLLWGKMMRDMKMKADVKILVDFPEIDLTRWCAEQIFDAKAQKGMVLAFRRKNSPDPVQILPLDGICPDSVYEVEYFTGETETLSGKELQVYCAKLEKPRSFLLFKYSVKQ